MDQAGYDQILWNRWLDDFVFDGQYIINVKLFLYFEGLIEQHADFVNSHVCDAT